MNTGITIDLLGLILQVPPSGADTAGPSWLEPSTLVAILGAVGFGGIVTALLTLGPTRRKIRQEAESAGSTATSVLTSSAISLLDPMRKQIDLLNAQVNATESHIELLEAQVRSLGGVPIDPPPVVTPK